MHFNLLSSAIQVLWTLTFASQLVLLVVLLGRNRAARYPWFTAYIGVSTLNMLAQKLLLERMAMIPAQTIILTLSDLVSIIALLVVAEVAFQSFQGLPRGLWLAWSLPVAAIAIWILVLLGPWPHLQDFALETPIGKLKFMQFAAQKIGLLAYMITVELGLLVLLHGRSFKAPWQSHTQKLVIGLSTIAIGQLSVEGIVLGISKTAHPHSQAEYVQIMKFIDKLYYSGPTIYVLVLIWWIFWLWNEEQGIGLAAIALPIAPLTTPKPVYLEATNLETTSPESTSSETPSPETIGLAAETLPAETLIATSVAPPQPTAAPEVPAPSEAEVAVAAASEEAASVDEKPAATPPAKPKTPAKSAPAKKKAAKKSAEAKQPKPKPAKKKQSKGKKTPPTA